MAQMEVSYSRRLDYQYMMLETDEEARSDYRLSMLINNRINGIFTCTCSADEWKKYA